MFEMQHGILMKFLSSRSKPQPFVGAVIKLTIWLLNFLVFDVFHRAFHGHRMLQEAVDVLIASLLSTGNSYCKVYSAGRCLIKSSLRAEGNAVVVGRRVESGFMCCIGANDRLSTAYCPRPQLSECMLPRVVHDLALAKQRALLKHYGLLASICLE